MRSTTKSPCFTIVTEPFYITQIKMFDFGRKNVMTNSLLFPWLSKSLDVPTRRHLYILGERHTCSGGHEEKALFQYKKELDIRKIFYSVATVYSTRNSRNFFLLCLSLFFPFFTGSRCYHWDRRKETQLKP